VARGTGVGSTEYRWYLAAQVVSLAGTMMGYTALFWLVLHLRPGGAPGLAAVQQATSAAQRGHALSAYNSGFIGWPPSPPPPGRAGRWPAPAWSSRPAPRPYS
jgi:hypothetical protein